MIKAPLENSNFVQWAISLERSSQYCRFLPAGQSSAEANTCGRKVDARQEKGSFGEKSPNTTTGRFSRLDVDRDHQGCKLLFDELSTLSDTFFSVFKYLIGIAKPSLIQNEPNQTQFRSIFVHFSIVSVESVSLMTKLLILRR